MHLSAYMELRNLRDEDVAAAIGKTRVSVSRYRRKLIRPSWQTIDKIERWSKRVVTSSDWKDVRSPKRKQRVAVIPELMGEVA